MKRYKSVEPFMEPTSVLDVFGTDQAVTEMTASDRGFLCGLIRDRRPKKIVEVGVAGGGTTAVILECIRELKLDCALYSVDLSERLYHDQEKRTGYIADIVAERGGADIKSLAADKHHLMLGKLLPERLDEIGSGIDLLILDTMHVMPGEILDFIAAFPYLTHDATVVLHDTRYHYMQRKKAGYATSILLQSVTADKFLNNQDGYPNIAAFQLNSDTAAYMADMFSALMIRWAYIPEEEHLSSYEAVIVKHYDPQCLSLFKQAVAEAKNYLLQWRMPRFGGFRHIVVYGGGNRSQVFLWYCKGLGIKIDGIVVSDDHLPREAGSPDACELSSDLTWGSFYGLNIQTGARYGIPIYPYSQIPFDPSETLIVQTTRFSEVTQKLQESNWHWIDLPGMFWAEFGF